MTAQNTDRRIQIFEEYPISKAVMTLVAPSIAGMLVMMLYNLADTWFVGMLDDAYETAAVSLVAPVILAFNAVNNMFGVGGSSLMSRALGYKDYDKVARTSAFSVWGAIVAGIAFSAIVIAFQNPVMKLIGADGLNWEPTLQYLRYTVMWGAMPSILNVVMGFLIKAEGSAMLASIGTISGCVLNVILDPFFILPQFLGMGAAGAGLATFISNCVACLYFFVLIAKRGKKSFVCIDPKKAIPRDGIAKEVFAVGIPSAIQNLLNVTGMTILNNFAAEFGSAAVSAMGISHKVCMLPLYISMGFASGANPIASYNYGSKNYKRAKDCVKFTALIGLSVSIVIMVLYYLFSAQIMGMFMKNEAIIDYGAVFIRSMCVGIPFLCIDFIGVGIYQAFGYGKLALLFAIGRKLILEIPFTFLLNKVYPLYGLAWAQTCTEFILGIVAVIVLSVMFKKLLDETSEEH